MREVSNKICGTSRQQLPELKAEQQAIMAFTALESSSKFPCLLPEQEVDEETGMLFEETGRKDCFDQRNCIITKGEKAESDGSGKNNNNVIIINSNNDTGMTRPAQTTDHLDFSSSKKNTSTNTSIDINTVNNNINNDDCQQPKQFDITAFDMYPYNAWDEEYEKPHKSYIGVLGTVITIFLFAYVIFNGLQRFLNDEIERSISPRIRTDEDSSEIGALGLLLFYDGQPFYDESFFRISYRYRAIYNGDVENDVRPRVYVDIPSKTCTVYNSTTSPGKNATFGCPDMDAASRLLAAEKQRRITESSSTDNNDDINNFPVVPVTMGSYGSDAYWFLEVKIQDCASYGEAANITCANSTQVGEKFREGGFTFDFVMSSQISRTESLWKNLYMEIELPRWTGVETYFKKTQSYETDRFLQETTQNHLDYNYYTASSLRSNTRQSGDSYITFYIRLYEEVEEEKIAHYSFNDIVSDIGGAWEVIMIIMTFGFLGFNFFLYQQKIHQERKKLTRLSE